MNWGDIPANTNIGNFPTSGNVVGDTDQQTLTNKRITPRSATLSNPAILNPAGDTIDIVAITALAQGLTVNAPTGTPAEGQTIRLRILDNGSAQTLTFNAIYQGGSLGLPVATLGSATISLIMEFEWDSSVNKWRLTGKAA